MAESLFSPSWYRVATLKPRLRSHAQIHRHHYRGQIWHVVQDHVSGQFHRFSPAALTVIAQMDGRRTVNEIWESAIAQLGDDAPTQEETIRLLAQLHFADLLVSDVPPDGIEVFDRYQKQQRQTWMSRLGSPLSLRFPLFDPERLLQALHPLVRPLFSWFGVALWLGVVLTGAVLAGVHWSELTQDVVDRALAPANLLAIGLTFPFVKALHELAHGMTTKHWGGEVHEMGVMLLVLMPVPYVDASAASAFRERRKRATVGAAGILVEMFVAALALFVWLNVEPGAVRATAYNVMLISGVSTLLFNANPLLRFDGYFILSDLIEIPNLAQRSTEYLGYLVERHLFGTADAISPATAPGEPAWFVTYGIASFVYRIFLTIRIVLFILGKFFVVGILIGCVTLAKMLVLPLWKRIKYVLTAPRLEERRERAIAASLGLALFVLGIVFVLPLPRRSVAEGVIWLPENAIVRADVDGFAVRLLATPGSRVEPGDPLVECTDDTISAREQALQARLLQVRLEEDAYRTTDRVKASLAAMERALVETELARARERLDALVIRSRAAGTFVVPQPDDVPGRFLGRGTTVGYVVDLSSLVARVVVEQKDVALVRHDTRRVRARLAENAGNEVGARILREVPSGSESLPSAALGLPGGGRVATRPGTEGNAKAFERLFQFDILLPGDLGVVNAGGRVHVRFEHGPASLGKQVYLAARRVFLSRFGV